MSKFGLVNPGFSFRTTGPLTRGPWIRSSEWVVWHDLSIIWTRPDGVQFRGRGPYLGLGTYYLIEGNWQDQFTQPGVYNVEFTELVRPEIQQLTWYVCGDNLVSLDIERGFRMCPSLTHSTIGIAVNLRLDVTRLGQILPSTMYKFSPRDISGYGDVTNWVFPAGLHTMDMQSMPNVTGVVTGWVIPQEIVYFYTFSNPGLTGDVSQWNAVPGRAGSALWFQLQNCPGLTYGTGGWLSGMSHSGARYILYGCNFTQAEVDRVLADCRAAETTTPGQGSQLWIHTTNAAPSPTGDADAAWLVSQGWNVITS